MKRATYSQPDSARYSAQKSGMSHGGIYDAEVIVGATVEPVSEHDIRTAVRAHFCSSRIKVMRELRAGDRSDIQGDIRFPNGLPTIAGPSYVRFKAKVESNGNLSFAGPHDAVAVLIPHDLLGNYPWAHADGIDDLLAYHGCSSVDELFEKHGVPVH